MKFRQLELFGEMPPEKESPPMHVHEAEEGSEVLPVPAEAPVPEVPVMQVELAAPVLPVGAESQQEEPSHISGVTPPSAQKGSRRHSRHARESSVIIELPPDEVLYTRQYYGIGEVAAMFQVKVSVLRYWESEFDVLDLRKNRKGDRFFRPDDIKTVRLIYHLLRERRFTIEGAREYIRRNTRGRERVEAIETLRRIRGFLVGLRESLASRTPSL